MEPPPITVQIAYVPQPRISGEYWIRTSGPLFTNASLAERWFKPLTQLSEFFLKILLSQEASLVDNT